MNGKRIVVTGAASGIGAQTAALIEAAGDHVVAVDLRPVEGASEAHGADLGDPDSIEALVDALGEAPIDALCNVAGVPGTAGADKVMRINFLGLRMLSERLVDRMRPGSAIVNVASFTGVGWPRRLAAHRELATTPSFAAGLEWLARHPVDEDECYPYSKEALIVWTQLAAVAWMPRGVRVNVVSPGPVETPLLDDFRSSLGEERVQEDIDRAGRPGTAPEVAPVIRFLCSDDARWINGANIAVDGGVAASFAVE